MKGLFLGNINPEGAKLAGSGKKLNPFSLLGNISSKDKFANFIAKLLKKEGEAEGKLSIVAAIPTVISPVDSSNKKVGIGIKSSQNSGKNTKNILSGENVNLSKEASSTKLIGKKFSVKPNIESLESKKELINSFSGDKEKLIKGFLGDKEKLVKETLGYKESVKIINSSHISSPNIKIVKMAAPFVLEKEITQKQTDVKKIIIDKMSNLKEQSIIPIFMKKNQQPNVENKNKNFKTITVENEKLDKVEKTSVDNIKSKITEINNNKNNMISNENSGENFKSNNDVNVRIVTLKKNKVSMEDQVNKVIEKLNLKHNEQRIQGELKGNIINTNKQGAVIEKIMEAIKLAQKQRPTHRAVIELEPKSLGKIEVKISISQDQKVEIHVKAENPAVKTMVESSFSSLSSFIGQNGNSNNADHKNTGRKSNNYLFDDLDISTEEQVQIIGDLLVDDRAINIMV